MKLRQQERQFELFEKARVRRPNRLRRLLWDGQMRELIGRTGTIAYIETGEHSQATLYSLIFEDGPEPTTGSFFASELDALTS